MIKLRSSNRQLPRPRSGAPPAVPGSRRGVTAERARRFGTIILLAGFPPVPIL